MNRAHSVIAGVGSWLAGHTGAWIVGLAVVWMAAAPRPMFGQWSGTNPVWTNSNVGIGTPSPSRPLEVTIPSDNWGMRLTATGSGSTDFSWHSLQTAGQGAFNINPLGGNVGIGTTNPGNYRLAVEGNIGARDVIVTNLAWSDYVFQPGYRLRPLSEVNAYILANHHLPDIPSEAEVKQKGVSLGEMQSKLLAKVEELTLHMIQQEKENKELLGRIAQLENRAAGSGAPSAGR